MLARITTGLLWSLILGAVALGYATSIARLAGAGIGV